MLKNLKISFSILLLFFSLHSFAENLFGDYDKNKEATSDLVKPKKVKLKALYCKPAFSKNYLFVMATDGKDLFAGRGLIFPDYLYDTDKFNLLKDTYKLKANDFLFKKTNDSFRFLGGQNRRPYVMKNTIQKKPNLNVFAHKNERVEKNNNKANHRIIVSTYDFESAVKFRKRVKDTVYKVEDEETVKQTDCNVRTISRFVFEDFNTETHCKTNKTLNCNIDSALKDWSKFTSEDLGFSCTSFSYGCSVNQLFKNSIAQNAGLTFGDDIISVNGKILKENNIYEIDDLIAASTPGTISIGYERYVNEKKKKGFIEVTLGTKNKKSQSKIENKKKTSTKTDPSINISLKSLGINKCTTFTLDKKGIGCWIREINETKPAFKAGLRKEDIILGFNNRAQKNISQIKKALKKIKTDSFVINAYSRASKKNKEYTITKTSYPLAFQAQLSQEKKSGNSLDTEKLKKGFEKIGSFLDKFK